MIIFSSGDPTYNPLNEFFKNYGMYLAFAMGGIVLIVILVLTFIALSKRRKAQEVEAKPVVNESAIFDALGGKDNIVSHSLNGSRIALELKDYSLVNEKTLNDLGVDSVIKMSNKITLVVKGDSKSFYSNLF